MPLEGCYCHCHVVPFANVDVLLLETVEVGQTVLCSAVLVVQFYWLNAQYCCSADIAQTWFDYLSWSEALWLEEASLMRFVCFTVAHEFYLALLEVVYQYPSFLHLFPHGLDVSGESQDLASILDRKQIFCYYVIALFNQIHSKCFYLFVYFRGLVLWWAVVDGFSVLYALNWLSWLDCAYWFRLEVFLTFLGKHRTLLWLLVFLLFR
jgi:hypothetical protein